jgi:hypothetical protein
MLKISIEGLDATRSYLANVEKQMRYAAAVALTRTAHEIRKASEKEVGKVFDQPTTFTRRAFGVKSANKQDLTAVVFIKDRQAEYLLPQIVGGSRKPTRKETRFTSQTRASGEFWVPGPGIKLNASGNIPLATVKSLAANLNKSGKFGRVFFGQPRPGAAFGIYATGKPGKKQRGALIPLLLQAAAPRYRARFDFQGLGERVASSEFNHQFARAFDQAMASAR